MAQTGVSIQRKAGQAIDEAYLQLVFKECPTACGALVVADGELLVNRGANPVDVAFIRATEAEYADSDIYWYFCNSESAINLSKDVPPYVLITEGEELSPVIAIIPEGNFPSYAKTDSSHPPEHFLADGLAEKFTNMLDLLDGDVDKFMEKIEKPFFRKEMMLTSVSRGYITIIAKNGKSVTFAQGDTHSEPEFTWGWTSNTFGYGTGKGTTVQPDATPASAFPKRSKSTVREAFNGGAAQVAAPDNAGGSDDKARQAVLLAKYVVKKDRPPSSLDRTRKGEWFKNRIGYKPPLWEARCEIEFFVDTKGELIPWNVIKKLSMADQLALQTRLHNPARASDTSPEHIPAGDAPLSNADKAVTEAILPILSPKAREALQKYMSDEKVKKKIAENSSIVTDPSTVTKLEAKFADFATQLGAKSIADFLCYDYEMFFEIAKLRPDAAAVMTWTFRNMLAPHWIKQQEAKNTQLSQAETHQLAQEELKPATATAFPKRKKANG